MEFLRNIILIVMLIVLIFIAKESMHIVSTPWFLFTLFLVVVITMIIIIKLNRMGGKNNE